MKSIKTNYAFYLIGLCLIIYSCDFEADKNEINKDRKCKQDFLDSLNSSYKYWTLAENQKDSADIYYMENTMLNNLSIECEEFKKISEVIVMNLNVRHVIDLPTSPFVDSIKAIRSKRSD